jgi:hypothetical protein
MGQCVTEAEEQGTCGEGTVRPTAASRPELSHTAASRAPRYSADLSRSADELPAEAAPCRGGVAGSHARISVNQG